METINFRGRRGDTRKKWAGFVYCNWTVLDEPVKRGPGGSLHVSCICACGTRRYVEIYSLSRGISKSCGCLTGSGGKVTVQKN